MVKMFAAAAIASFALALTPVSALAARGKHHAMHQMMVMVNGHMAPVMVMVNGHLTPVFIESANGS